LVSLCLQTSLNDQQRQYLTNLQYSAEHLLGVINLILDFSRLEADSLELSVCPCELPKMIKHIAQLCHFSALDKGLDFNLEHGEDLPEIILCDELRLKQVLLNLCGNGIKFTHKGKVTLNVSVIVDSEQQEQLKFDVVDSGIGIEPDKLDALFAPFVQGDASISKEFGGTGLGLSISKRIVSLMKGTITCTNNEGPGATFTVLLPLERSIDAQAQIVEPKTLDIPDLSTKTLLIAEDNLINQLVVCEMLKPTDALVYVANDGIEALDMLGQHSVDLILMDIQMPKMDGCEAMRQIALQPQFSHIPVIAMTANVMEQDVKKYLSLGMKAHIGKPIAQQTLLQVVARWLKTEVSVK
jgi:CheY-like chemotaxis protein